MPLLHALTCPKYPNSVARVQVAIPFLVNLLFIFVMPVATSSRRKKNARSNRAPSSDGIEEDQPTQGGEDDEVDDDEEGDQPSRSARVKKEKLVKGRRLAPKAPARDEDDDDDDGEGDAEDADMGRIDVENFKDQPLSREDAGKVSGIIKDWEMIRKRNDDAAKGLMENIGISMADLMEEEEATKVIVFRLPI